MKPRKNLHLNLPQMLVEGIEKAAQAEHITVDEFVRDAMERRLRDRHLYFSIQALSENLPPRLTANKP